MRGIGARYSSRAGVCGGAGVEGKRVSAVEGVERGMVPLIDTY